MGDMLGPQIPQILKKDIFVEMRNTPIFCRIIN